MNARAAAVRRLHRERPRDRFVRGSFVFAGSAVALSLGFGGLDLADAFSARRIENLHRFLAEVRPFPLQGKAFDFSEALAFYRGIWEEKGRAAAADTLAASILAILLAAAMGLPLALLAARNVSRSDPFGVAARPPGLPSRVAWRALTATCRLALTGLRALPEYLVAFFLLAMMGPGPWPVVFALAFHNAGILGRLTSETIENAAAAPLRALRGAGASRAQISLLVLPAMLLSRFLLFLFYRWETCVREATVLGMLGFVSLGYWISDFRVRGQMDGLVFLIAVGGAIVMLGDFASALVRRSVRESHSRIFWKVTAGR